MPIAAAAGRQATRPDGNPSTAKAPVASVVTVRLTDVETTLSFTRYDYPGWNLGPVGWCVWAVLLIYATTNGVNLADDANRESFSILFDPHGEVLARH